MGIRPLHDRVLVEPLSAEEKTAGGIIIPDTAQEKPQEGKIVAVGNGARAMTGKYRRLTSKRATKSFMASGRVLKLKLMAKTFL